MMTRVKLFTFVIFYLAALGVTSAKSPDQTHNNDIAVGSVIEVALGKLHPTQSVIAYEQVNYKLALYREDRQALFSDLCKNAGWGSKVKFNAISMPNDKGSYTCLNAQEKKRKKDKLKTVVLGANNELFLTDGHHTFSVFHDMPNGGPELTVTVFVEAKMAIASQDAFWTQMAEEGKAWMYDASGAKIDYKTMPKSVGRASLNNDPYRAAAYFLRNGVWAKPEPAIAFVEFYWAQYIREQAATKHSELLFPGYHTAFEYIQWLERIHNHLMSLNKDQEVYGQYTAQDIGWTGDADFISLSKLLCDRSTNDSAESSTKKHSPYVSIGRLGTALKQRGMPVDCDSRQYLSRTSLDTGLLALPDALNTDGTANVLIEIPAGSNAKWQQSKQRPHQLEWEFKDGKPREVEYLAYPANYGVVSNTLLSKSNGGDGDPLDILVLGKALPKGTFQKVRIIAVMRMLDNGEHDDKLLAVPLSGVFSAVDNLAKLNKQFPEVTQQIQRWFEHYKGPNHEVIVQQIDNEKSAIALVIASML